MKLCRCNQQKSIFVSKQDEKSMMFPKTQNMLFSKCAFEGQFCLDILHWLQVVTPCDIVFPGGDELGDQVDQLHRRNGSPFVGHQTLMTSYLNAMAMHVEEKGVNHSANWLTLLPLFQKQLEHRNQSRLVLKLMGIEVLWVSFRWETEPKTFFEQFPELL